jgi:hypothetical protein
MCLVEEVTSDLPWLSIFFFAAAYDIDIPTLKAIPLNLRHYRTLKYEMHLYLAELVRDNEFLTAKIEFAVLCPLYSPHDDVLRQTDHSAIPPAIFAICDFPDNDTVKLDGVDVKFLGIGDDLIDRDRNTQVVMNGKKVTPW